MLERRSTTAYINLRAKAQLAMKVICVNKESIVVAIAILASAVYFCLDIYQLKMDSREVRRVPFENF